MTELKKHKLDLDDRLDHLIVSSRGTIEFDPEKFLKSIENWDGTTPSFQQCVLTLIVQAILMSDGSSSIPWLAHKIDASLPTIKRWAIGRSCPHTQMQRVVIKLIAERIRELWNSSGAHVLAHFLATR